MKKLLLNEKKKKNTSHRVCLKVLLVESAEVPRFRLALVDSGLARFRLPMIKGDECVPA